MKWIVAIICVCGAMIFGIYIYRQPIDPCLALRTNALGNRLSEYFYFTNTSHASERKLKRQKKCNAKTQNLEIHALYEKLIWQRQDQSIDYKSDPEAEWNQLQNDGSLKANYLIYWQAVRPQARAFYQKNLKLVDTPYPVVHFRCSDIPFLRHYHYHLTKGRSVNWMIEKIKERGFSKVIFLNCNRHRSLDTQASCGKYVDFYINLFKVADIEVQTQCTSIMEDFSTMVASPLLVSLNASSYAFMAGVAKEPQNYISCNMGIESNDQYFAQTEADWVLDPLAPLLHKDVADYHDADDVINKLSE